MPSASQQVNFRVSEGEVREVVESGLVGQEALSAWFKRVGLAYARGELVGPARSRPRHGVLGAASSAQARANVKPIPKGGKS